MLTQLFQSLGMNEAKRNVVRGPVNLYISMVLKTSHYFHPDPNIPNKPMQWLI